MKNEIETTINRWVFNRVYKQINASCSYCKWHKGENSTNKYYGGFVSGVFKKSLTHPSWKLCSKNRKQWMKKPVKTRNKNHEYVEIYW